MNQDPNHDQEDDAPELRKLLEEMHGKDMPLPEDNQDFEQNEVSPTEQGAPLEVQMPAAASLRPDAAETDDTGFPLPEGSTPLHLNEEQIFESEPRFITPPDNLRHDLERIPVNLDFSLRTLTKTLGEVSQIQLGEIITLGCGAEGPVELKANGRVFAKGRLVMVEEQLAIEVIEKFDS